MKRANVGERYIEIVGKHYLEVTIKEMRISKTTKIGALTLIALFLLYFGLNYLKGFNVFKRANVYYAAFPEVKNVNIASPVLVNGYKVGVV